jgi:sugar/nucleoside kinase (ribokinase family)
MRTGGYMAVVMVGSMAFDTIHTPTVSRERVLGGACVYASIACSYFDRTHIVGVVGDDFKDENLKVLKDHKIDIGGVKRMAGKSFFWEGRYNADMKTRDTIKTELNVFEQFDPVMPESFKYVPYLFLANIDPDLQLKVLNSMQKLKFSMVDTMNLWISIKKEKLTEVFSKVDCVVLNDEEIRLFTGKDNILQGAKEIQAIGPRYVIIKKGEHGAALAAPGSYFSLPSYPVDSVVDPTGAGDSFGGAFIGYLSKANKTDVTSLKKAVAYGNTVASFTVEDFSVDRLKNLTRRDIDKRMKKIKKMVRF